MSFDIDVLIVGAGPTGLMLANELTAFGVSLRIVDKAPVRSDKSRAIVVQSRGLELLDRHGLGHALVARGTTGKGIDYYVYGRPAASMDMSDFEFKDTAFSDTLLASQADTEDLLEAHLLKTLGPDHRGIERPTTVSSIVADSEGVDVVLAHGATGSAATETLRCRYVVGCDGAHSSVRHAANIAFEGDAYLQSFLLADVHIDNWPDRPAGRTQMFWDKGFLTLLPYAESKGIMRLIACRPLPVDAAAEVRARNEEPTLETFQEFFSSMAHFPPDRMPKLTDPVWVTAFRLHHRVAATYRSGRLLLAGDAAHIHSPAGGQGMNTGLGDAANLGWKLAAAVRASRTTAQNKSTAATLGLTDTLLDSYTAERRPIGIHLLRTTDHMFIAATTATPFFVWLRNAAIRWVMPLILRVRRQREQMIGSMNQLRVRYRRSPVVGTAPGWKGVVRGGDRAPDGRVYLDGQAAEEGKDTGLLSQMWQGGAGITSYHLLLFTGATSKPVDSTTTKTILAAADTAAATYKPVGFDATVAHIVAGSALQAGVFVESQGGHAADADVFVDRDAYLHGRYGFGSRPGYALVRPDGHVEHVGSLASLPQLAAWVEDRGVAAAAAAAAAKANRPWWKFW
ncbi:hypothetical protein SCUCBS95973_003381 [Sporothrix curviconia]|uniref:FAD-binding domain-containing protein n=1 Tax=Sporothrix curviconia TaxID=1260050 RepID=A0ABP0BF05_9PEZI